MTVQSMTGFARYATVFTHTSSLCGDNNTKDNQAFLSGTDVTNDQVSERVMRIVWEIRSVNGKSLDLRMRLPQGYDDLEPVLRRIINENFSRGSFQVSLNLEQQQSHGGLAINQELLHKVLQSAESLTKLYGLAPATTDGVLALRGIFDQPQTEDDESYKNAMRAALIDSFGLAAHQLVEMRRQEGEKLTAILTEQINALAGLSSLARHDPSRTPEAISERLRNQVELLLEALHKSRGGQVIDLDESRLHMEVAFLATKADIQEEVDRLDMHVTAARNLLQSGGAVGRKLDFLSQEFNRETNTLCSKANAASITAIGLEMKAVIDQFREQIQNLE